MKSWIIISAGLLVPVSVSAQAGDSIPDEVTSSMIEEGARIFKGPGLCAACHGPDGKGLTAPDLTDDEWIHIDGSFEAIVARIIEGVAIADSRTGIPMLPRGGMPLTDDQVRAVAAYIWSLGSAQTQTLDGARRVRRR